MKTIRAAVLAGRACCAYLVGRIGDEELYRRINSARAGIGRPPIGPPRP